MGRAGGGRTLVDAFPRVGRRRTHDGDIALKVTDAVFVFVALDSQGRPRPCVKTRPQPRVASSETWPLEQEAGHPLQGDGGAPRGGPRRS